MRLKTLYILKKITHRANEREVCVKAGVAVTHNSELTRTLQNKILTKQLSRTEVETYFTQDKLKHYT